MSDTAITVTNLGKQYHISHQSQQRYVALRDVMANSAKQLGKRILHPRQALANQSSVTREAFWALKDVSFEVKQGEVVGIIGRNGAGKSTLLKVLSRITSPSTGHARIRGRLASLLEVGTGFHPELTGRENVFLNGAILGMSKAEITRQFDEIVAFAEVEKFLDTPVKRYSSGMYVRLAFAVAAHLEPEILVVDEVLAVGDASFQKKCLSKMEDVGRSGQTVLFVSHNMATIQALCKRSLVLDKGRVVADKPSSEAVKLYLEESMGCEEFSRPKQAGGRPTIIGGRVTPLLDGKAPQMQLEFDISTDTAHRVALDLRLKDSLAIPVGLGSYGAMRPADMIEVKPPLTRCSFILSTDHLATGLYYISLDITIPSVEHLDRAENCLSFELERQPEPGALHVLPQDWRYGCMELELSDLQVKTEFDALQAVPAVPALV